MSYKIFEHDPLLLPFEKDIELRMDNYAKKKLSLVGKEGSLSDFISAFTKLMTVGYIASGLLQPTRSISRAISSIGDGSIFV